MELHVTVRDRSGVEVGEIHLTPERRFGRTQEYLMTASVDRGPSLGHYRQTVLVEHNANPLGVLLAALLYLPPEQRVMEGEVVDSSSDYPHAGPPALDG